MKSISTLALVLLTCFVLSGCFSSNSDPNGTGNNNNTPPASSGPSHTSQQANISLFGVDNSNANVKEVDLGNGSALTLDSDSIGYAGFGLDVGALSNFQTATSSTQASRYHTAASRQQMASTSAEDEAEIRDVAEQLLQDLQDDLSAQGLVDRFDIIVNKVTRNAQALVVNYTIDLILTGDTGTSTLRNVLLSAFSSNGASGAPSDVSNSGTAYRLTMAVWISNGRVLCWTGSFLESVKDPVNNNFGDINRGTAVTDASQLQPVATSENFSQSVGTTEADILWVIDNSGSMSQEQSNLAAGATAFFQLLQSTNLNYHLGVARTEQTPSLGSCWELSMLSDNTSRFISPATTDAETEWNLISQPGTNGSTETGLFCAQNAFNNTTATNTGFDRANAPDIVVFVSDEPDNESYWNDRPDNINATHPNYDNQDLSQYLAYFKSKPITAFGLVGTATTPRATFQDPAAAGSDSSFNCSGEGGSASGGANYGEVISQTGGSRSSICANFASWETTFRGVVDAASGQASSFRTQNVPIASSVLVTVQGNSVSRDTAHQNGFDVIYDSSGAAIVFYGNAIPQAGNNINVSYDYLSSS